MARVGEDRLEVVVRNIGDATESGTAAAEVVGEDSIVAGLADRSLHSVESEAMERTATVERNTADCCW